MVTIDTEDLIDSAEVAVLLSLSSPNAVSVYRKRYDDFPAPAVDRGRCVLWVRQSVNAWAKATGRLQ